jgi:hypothetical protein
MGMLNIKHRIFNNMYGTINDLILDTANAPNPISFVLNNNPDTKKKNGIWNE